MIDVCVIGGGVSGLSVAHALRRQGHDVLVLERQVRAGGNAISERIGGFLMEHGPSTVAATATDVLGLSRDLGLDGDECAMGAGVRRRYLVSNGQLNGIRTGPLGFLLSDYLSVTARLRIMAEALIPRGGRVSEETVADFCARRFGREFTERVMDPLVAGIYAGRADELSVTAVFPRLVALEREHGAISRALITRVRAGARMPGSRFFSWRQGVGGLPAALTRDLGGVVRTGVVVRSVRRSAAGYTLDTSTGSLSARAVVVAAQARVAAGILETLDVPGAEAAHGIAVPPLAVVFLGYRRADVEHPLDGLGFLSAASEGRALNGAQFSSTMFEHRAPAGMVSIACYLGGARHPDLARRPGAELIEVARRELSELVGARGEPVVARVRGWPSGLPQYSLGHDARAQTLQSIGERLPGLFLAGNYLGGISVEACVTQAGETARAIGAYLASGDAAARDGGHGSHDGGITPTDPASLTATGAV